MLKQSRFLTAFQQDRNPLIQLNQDNIENTEKRRTMPPTLPTENATIQRFGGKRGVRSAECGVWKTRSVENAECGKCGA